VSRLVALGALLIAAAAHAADDDVPIPDHPMMRDRFFVGVGVVWAQSNVTANLNTGRVGLGTFIDFENDVGLKKNNAIGQFAFRMNISERWRLEAEYFSLNRDSDQTLSRTLDWGNLTFPINATVHGKSNLDDFRISVGYSFFRRKDKEIGFGVGAHVMSLDASISSPNFGSEGASQSAPLPVLTLYSQMALTDRWLFRARVDRLSLDTGEVNGSVYSSATDFVYQPWRHFGVGFGYRDINLQVSSASEGSSWRGKAQVRHTGPYLFFTSTF
jgi:hypothetical protein